MGREQGVLTVSVVFSTVHEVGSKQGVLTVSVVFSTVHEVGSKQGVLTIHGFVHVSAYYVYVLNIHTYLRNSTTKIPCTYVCIGANFCGNLLL